MKKVVLVLIVAFITLFNSCNVVKNKSRSKEHISTSQSSLSVTSTVKIDSSIIKNAITKTGKETTYTEETTTKKYDPAKDIEISANFKIDTSAIISGDTVLKLIDIKNGNTSLTIYQNKATKQLMAKVKTPEGNSNTAFSEISLKRVLNTKDSKEVDSSTNQTSIKVTADTSNQSKSETDSTKVQSDKEKKTGLNYMFVIAAIFAFLIFAFFKWR